MLSMFHQDKYDIPLLEIYCSQNFLTIFNHLPYNKCQFRLIYCFHILRSLCCHRQDIQFQSQLPLLANIALNIYSHLKMCSNLSHASFHFSIPLDEFIHLYIYTIRCLHTVQVHLSSLDMHHLLLEVHLFSMQILLWISIFFILLYQLFWRIARIFLLCHWLFSAYIYLNLSIHFSIIEKLPMQLGIYSYHLVSCIIVYRVMMILQ